jgi:Cu-Zn family superoxide dismutase
MLRSKVIPLFVGVSVLALGACAPEEEAVEPEAPAPEAVEEAAPAELVAVAALQPRADQTVVGTMTFTEGADGVTIVARFEQAPSGTHGLHIHEVGDCSSDDFKSAGGHFNPTGMPHGSPDDAERHAGDLGNIEVGEDGVGELTLVSDMITVAEGESSVIGRGVILHEKADDFETQPTGDAGSRLACGVVFLYGSEEEAMEAEAAMEDEAPAE